MFDKLRSTHARPLSTSYPNTRIDTCHGWIYDLYRRFDLNPGSGESLREAMQPPHQPATCKDWRDRDRNHVIVALVDQGEATPDLLETKRKVYSYSLAQLGRNDAARPPLKKLSSQTRFQLVDLLTDCARSHVQFIRRSPHAA
nr:hypothetical protein [Tabrizicola sp. TH137]